MNEVLFKFIIRLSYTNCFLIDILILKVLWLETVRQLTPVFELYMRLSWPEAIERDIFKLPGPTSIVSFRLPAGINPDLLLPEWFWHKSELEVSYSFLLKKKKFWDFLSKWVHLRSRTLQRNLALKKVNNSQELRYHDSRIRVQKTSIVLTDYKDRDTDRDRRSNIYLHHFL